MPAISSLFLPNMTGERGMVTRENCVAPRTLERYGVIEIVLRSTTKRHPDDSLSARVAQFGIVASDWKSVVISGVFTQKTVGPPDMVPQFVAT